MDDLVVGALQEGRVDRAERPHALRGQPRGEGDGMLLGDSDVEHPIGKGPGELVDAGARRHRRGDRADRRIAPRLGDQRLGEHAGIARRPGRALVLLAGQHVELLDAVELVGRGLGRRVAMPLLGHDMDEDRPLCGIADILEHRDEVVKIVAVDRPDIVEAQLLEQRAADRHAARIFVDLAGGVGERAGQLLRELLREIAQVKERAARHDLREIGGEPADRRRDRHVVVVEHDDQPVARLRGVVHRLVRHARGHRAVADHRDRLARPISELVRDREAERR